MLNPLVIAAVLSSLALQSPSASIVCQPDASTILAGEPLVLVVKVRNLTAAELLVPTDSDSLQRITVGAGGLRLTMTPQPFEADKMTPFVRPAPGEERTFLVLAGETAQLRVPGEYRMNVAYPELGASGEVQFTVLPYTPGALRQRAEKIYSVIFDRGNAERSLLAKKALTVMEPQVAEPLLCAMLKRDPGELDRSVAYALERSDNPTVVDCLAEILPRGRDITRNSVVQILQHMAERTSDAQLRLKIERTLANK